MPQDEPDPLAESIEFTGHNGRAVVDWARRTSEHYERDDKISASGLGDSPRDPFALNINGKVETPQPGDQFTFSDRAREFERFPGGQTPDNPWPRDHPMTPKENTVLYQVSARHGLPAGTVPEGVLAAKQNSRRPASTTGMAGVRHPVQSQRAPIPVRAEQFGEHKVTNITSRIGKK